MWLTPVRLAAAENLPPAIARYVGVDNVCAWPNLTLLRDGTIAAIIHNQPSHSRPPGDIDCWVSRDDGATWSAPIRLMNSTATDCGYPSSVQRADGKIITAYYSQAVENHDRYHMGVAIWDAPARERGVGVDTSQARPHLRT